MTTLSTPAGSPRLGPGVRVVERGRGHLQVGLGAERRVLVERDGPQAGALRRLARGEALDDDRPSTRLLERLAGAGLLAVPRTSLPVELHGCLGHEPTELLRAAGLEPASAVPGAPVLLLTSGEPAREHTDRLVGDGRIHLLAGVVDAVAVVGPLVVPGRTACLRCIDAQLAIADPAHPAVVHRYSHQQRADGGDDAGDPALVALALAWAARDLRALARGVRPASWSSTITLPHDGAASVHWRRHPECGCAWSA